MKKLLSAMASIALMSTPVMAEPVKEYYTMDSMGCMLLQECTDPVVEVFSLLDISSPYDNTDKFMKLVEKQIHEAPEYYLWTHKRWKHREV